MVLLVIRQLLKTVSDKINPLTNSRSGHQRCSVTKGVLRNFVKFTGKPLCQSLLFNIVAD